MIATATFGESIAAALSISIIGTEGHDLKCGCQFCDSSDAGRVHEDTGAYYCFSCQKALSAWDHLKLRLGKDEAKKIMIDLGKFQDFGTKSNGHSSSAVHHQANGKAPDAEALFLEVCRLKNVPPDAWRKYGAVPYRGGLRVPMFGSVPGNDGLSECSSIHITPENGKGMYEKGKPTGLFLPDEFPDPGQFCIIVEGPKDPAALHALGHLAIGLPGNRLKKEFAPLFKGVHCVILTDGDKAGREGGAVTYKLLHEAGAATVKTASFPDGMDARDVLKTEGVEGIGRILLNATATGEPGGGTEFDYGIITAAELLRKDCTVEFLIPHVLAKGQHHILGGPLKSCKSLIATDLAISLAMGGKFLNQFQAARTVRTTLLCGEAGWPVFQENIRRISNARGATEEHLGNLLTGVRLPKFGNPLYQDALIAHIVDQKVEVVIFDCAYRCIPGESVSNQFMMGEVLDSIGAALEAVGATLILLCHTPKHVAPGEPLELDNLAFAGFSEFAAQWLIVNRRRRYEPGTGSHALWAVIGGRAGHSGTYAIDLDEGEFHQGEDREWRVEVNRSDEARKDQQERREKANAEKQEEKLEENRKRIVNAVAKYRNGETKNIIRDHLGMRPQNLNPAWASLMEDGTLVAVEIKKLNREKPYEGYRLRETSNP